MKLRGSRSELVLAIAGLVLSAFGVREVWAATPNCAGAGKSGSPKGIRCVGTCPAPAAGPCAPSEYGIPTGRGTFPAGHPTYPNKNYAFCACPGEGESSCCHLVGVLNDAGTAITAYTVNGDCPSCPASGTCQTSNQNGETVAECFSG